MSFSVGYKLKKKTLREKTHYSLATVVSSIGDSGHLWEELLLPAV